MAVFITGGTGFIGRKLIERLSQADETLHLLVRSLSSIADLEKNEKIRFFYGDVTDENSVLKGLKGCDKVYHLAAYARNWSFDENQYYNVNVAGAIKVFEAALKNRMQKVVFTSSCVTLGPGGNDIVAEKDWKEREHFYTEYEKSKYLAELEALKFVEKGLNLVMVNPTRVYGPGLLTEANSVTKIAQQYVEGKFPLILDHGKEIANYAFVEDVVTGHLLAMEKGRTGERYLLGGDNISLKNLFSLLDEITETKHLQISIPPKIARFIAWLEEKKATMLKKYPQISRDWVDTFLQNWAFSSEKSEKELGYKYLPLKQGLKITCDWILNQKSVLHRNPLKPLPEAKQNKR
jgi:nucleoside-diphosphate-sugar epimerase